MRAACGRPDRTTGGCGGTCLVGGGPFSSISITAAAAARRCRASRTLLWDGGRCSSRPPQGSRPGKLGVVSCAGPFARFSRRARRCLRTHPPQLAPARTAAPRPAIGLHPSPVRAAAWLARRCSSLQQLQLLLLSSRCQPRPAPLFRSRQARCASATRPPSGAATKAPSATCEARRTPSLLFSTWSDVHARTPAARPACLQAKAVPRKQLAAGGSFAARAAHHTLCD